MDGIETTVSGNGFKDLTGKRFGRWQVLSRPDDLPRTPARWLCRCDCGTERVITSSNLVRGMSKSCGCGRLGPKTAFESRFWSKVDKSGHCWFWTASRDKRGYGKFGACKEASSGLAHRIAYELTFGPLAAGINALHRCDNNSCCNPYHLYPSTQAENMRDKILKNRHARGADHPFSKLTWEQIMEIRRRYVRETGIVKRLAAEFAVHHMTISRIIRWVTYRYPPRSLLTPQPQSPNC
jgi:hypothetical protein